MGQVLLSAKILCNGKTFSVATTHFTWTPDGIPNHYQEEDARALLDLLSKMPGDVALCGDFNMPRHVNALYNLFTARYSDVIPQSYFSSIDLSLHRSRNNPAAVADLCHYMVDYLFLSNGYLAENVHFQSGVSDHYALIADLECIATQPLAQRDKEKIKME
jgi:endonuclease/exonuclease/phosphatase family metal-dependent hydrolase